MCHCVGQICLFECVGGYPLIELGYIHKEQYHGKAAETARDEDSGAGGEACTPEASKTDP